MLTAPTRVGYTFTGWYTLDVGGDRVIVSTLCLTPNDHTLYAHWAQDGVGMVTATFVDGAFVVHQQTTAGDKVAPPQVPARLGQKVAWKNGGADRNFADPVTSDITLTAFWTDEDYAVSFDTNGYGQVFPTADDGKVQYGKTYDTLPTPSGAPADRTFAGWYTLGDGGARVTAATTYSPPNPGSHTLYAHWTANEHTVSFLDANGTLLQRLTVAHNAKSPPHRKSRRGPAIPING
jgi:uncharacterized repeat protein (TIGR02543 family)